MTTVEEIFGCEWVKAHICILVECMLIALLAGDEGGSAQFLTGACTMHMACSLMYTIINLIIFLTASFYYSLSLSCSTCIFLLQFLSQGADRGYLNTG